jgi:hypothetical protein
VQQSGALILRNIAMQGTVSVRGGGSAIISGSTLTSALTIYSSASASLSETTLSSTPTIESGAIVSITGGSVEWPGEKYVSVNDTVLALASTSLPPLIVVNSSGTLTLTDVPHVPYDFVPSFIVYDGATVTVDEVAWSGPTAPSSAVFLVANAGTSAANGYYRLDGKSPVTNSHGEQNGKPKYCNVDACNAYNVVYSNNGWAVDGIAWRIVRHGNILYDNLNRGHTAPTTGWRVKEGSGGTGPAPTITWLDKL